MMGRSFLEIVMLITIMSKSYGRQREIFSNSSISSALTDILPGDVLILNGGTYSGSENCNINVITPNITILGSTGRVIIDCNGASRHMTIFGSNVTLKDMEVVNGYASDRGGCIMILGALATYIINVHFFNCSSNYGGGLYVHSVVIFAPTLINVTFTDCFAYDGGGVFLQSSSIIAIACTFRSNIAQNLGGGIFLSLSTASLDGDLTIFENNRAVQVGGGICLLDGSFLTVHGKIRFSRNTALGGGAVYVQGAVLEVKNDAYFFENYALEYGGAIAAIATSSLFAVSLTFSCTSIFRSNRVIEGSGSGGAILVQGMDEKTALFRFAGNVTLTNNTAPSGGAVCVQFNSQMVMDGESYFVQNSAVGGMGGAAFVFTDSSITIAWAYIDGNSAGMRGGGIYLVDSNASIRGILSDNIAGDAGGAIALYGASTAHLYDVTLEHNSVSGISKASCTQTDPCGGGALFLTDKTELRLGPQAAMKWNLVEGSGDGGALLLCQSAVAFVHNVSICNNSADGRGGGASSLDGSSIFFSQSLFNSNRAVSDGGAVYAGGVAVGFISVTVSSNFAGQNGGGLCLFAPLSLELVNLFLNNSANGQGGALFASGSLAKVTVQLYSSAEFLGNAAGADGGAVALEGDAAFQIDLDQCLPPCLDAMRGNGYCDVEW